MSYVKIVLYSFECDAGSCDVVSDDLIPDMSEDRPWTVRVAEDYLTRRHGWTARHGRHYCPAHKRLEREARGEQ